MSEFTDKSKQSMQADSMAKENAVPKPVHESISKDENEAVQIESSPDVVEPENTSGSHTENPSLDCTTDKSLCQIKSDISSLSSTVQNIEDSSAKAAKEMYELHKLYHNEFANRLKSMQDELEEYRERDKGRVFDGILGDVAKLYTGYESVLDEIEDTRIKKRMGYMFMDIAQILEASGAAKWKSKPGDKRNAKYCQVVERVPTDNPELHDTIAKSRSTGFYVENRPLVKEFVDLYLFNEKSADKSAESQGGA